MFKKSNYFILIFLYSFLHITIFSESPIEHLKKPLVYITYEYPNEKSILLFFKILNVDHRNTYHFNSITKLNNNFNIVENKSFWIPSNSKSKKNLTFHSDKSGSYGNNMTFNILHKSISLKVKNTFKGGLLILFLEPKKFSLVNTTSFVYSNNSNDSSLRNNNQLTKLVLYKYQAIDKNNDNIPDTSFSKKALTANPGDKVFYKLVALNEGETKVTNLFIQDTIPEYTTLSPGDNSISERGKPSWRINNGDFNEILSKPQFGENGIISTNIPTLNSGETITIYYNVKINN